MRGCPPRSAAADIHDWLVPVLMQGESSRSRRLPNSPLTNPGLFVKFPIPSGAGVVQVNVQGVLKVFGSDGASFA
jgi:hypothetical protein